MIKTTFDLSKLMKGKLNIPAWVPHTSICRINWQVMDLYLSFEGRGKEESRWPYVYAYSANKNIC